MSGVTIVIKILFTILYQYSYFLNISKIKCIHKQHPRQKYIC